MMGRCVCVCRRLVECGVGRWCGGECRGGSGVNHGWRRVDGWGWIGGRCVCVCVGVVVCMVGRWCKGGRWSGSGVDRGQREVMGWWAVSVRWGVAGLRVRRCMVCRVDGLVERRGIMCR